MGLIEAGDRDVAGKMNSVAENPAITKLNLIQEISTSKLVPFHRGSIRSWRLPAEENLHADSRRAAKV